jgi:hypothetical protein
VRHRRGRRDETIISFRTKDDPIVVPAGRNGAGKMLVAGAVEVDTASRGARLKVIEGFGRDQIHAFVHGAVAPQTQVVTDDWLPTTASPVSGTAGHASELRSVGVAAATIAGTLRRSALMAPPYRCLRTPAFGPPPDRDLTSDPRDGRAGFSL